MDLSPDQARHGLTVLTRLAQHSPAGERRLAELLSSNVDALAVPAAEVAVETGEPMDRLLTEALLSVPVSTETLLALRSGGSTGALALLIGELLAQRILTEDTVEPRAAVTALARHADGLIDQARITEALRIAEQAVIRARALPAKFNDPGLMVALDVLARAQTASGDHDLASRTSTEAVAVAERRFGGVAEPYLGSLLETQATLRRNAGHPREALTAYTRAAEVWREILRVPDLDTKLLTARAMDSESGRGVVFFEPDGSARVERWIHIAIGYPSENLYEGPVFGSYRVNAVMAEDGGIYVGPRTWSPTAARLSTGRVLRERARTLLILDNPREAIDDLRESVALLDELSGSGLPAHLAALGYAESVLALCLHWLGHPADASAATRRALERLTIVTGGEQDARSELAKQAWFGVAMVSRHDRHWLGYCTQLVALGQTVAEADGGRLLAALLDQLHDQAVLLKNREVPAAIPLLQQVIDAARDPVRQAVSLVSLANAHLRGDNREDATSAARRATELTEAMSPANPTLVATAYHTLSRCHAEQRDLAAAVETAGRAVAAYLPVLETDPDQHAGPAIDMLAWYQHALIGATASTRLTLPPEMCVAVVGLLDASLALPERSVGALANLGFSVVTQFARDRDLDRTRTAYLSLLSFTHRHDSSSEARTARALVGWNVTMCFVDCDDYATARLAVDDLAALVAADPGNPNYVVEHGKCASELIAARWNSGSHAEAREVLRDTESSLRSPEYLQARQCDIGDPPANFLATLDAIARQPD